MANTHGFKAGDTVISITAIGLVKGRTYRVIKVTDMYVYIDVGQDKSNGWVPQCFELVKKKTRNLPEWF